MIREIDGDVFQTQQDTVLCPCNAAGAMGAGLAQQVKQRYPDVYALYLQCYPKASIETVDRQLARTLLTTKLPDRKRILLFCTKYHWKENADVSLIEANLMHLKTAWKRLEIGTLAMPLIGCGKGKLHWERQVKPILMKHFGETEHDIVVVRQ